MKRLSTFFVLCGLALVSCSLSLDFDETDGLPCPCDPDHVCLTASNVCRKRSSVELYKSCELGAEQAADDLCPAGSICESVNGVGRRCLPMCTPSTYATPEAAGEVAAKCQSGYTCWRGDRGLGVCSEGECDPLRQDCENGQNCVAFNGAGVCFTPCEIFRKNPPPCAANQVCHPIGSSSFTACIDAGDNLLGDICAEADLCAPRDSSSRARSMVCDRPDGDDGQRRCRAICQCPRDGQFCDNAECGVNAACGRARANIDAPTGLGLGLCIE